MSNLIESIQQAEAEAKAEAIEVYRAILSRNASPEATDAKKLRAVMAVLGFGVDRLSQDLAALDEASRLEGVVASLPRDLAERVEEANREWQAYIAETSRIKAEREAKEGELLDNIRDLQRLDVAPRAAKKALAALRKRHWQLFGEPAPEVASE